MFYAGILNCMQVNLSQWRKKKSLWDTLRIHRPPPERLKSGMLLVILSPQTKTTVGLIGTEIQEGDKIMPTRKREKKTVTKRLGWEQDRDICVLMDFHIQLCWFYWSGAGRTQQLTAGTFSHRPPHIRLDGRPAVFLISKKLFRAKCLIWIPDIVWMS